MCAGPHAWDDAGVCYGLKWTFLCSDSLPELNTDVYIANYYLLYILSGIYMCKSVDTHMREVFPPLFSVLQYRSNPNGSLSPPCINKGVRVCVFVCMLCVCLCVSVCGNGSCYQFMLSIIYVR